MPACFQHLCRFGDVLRGQAGKAEPLCLQMDRPEQAHIIQNSGNSRRQHHFGIADSHKLRHHKSYCTHNGRRKLPSGRGNCFHCSGKFLSVAGFFHQRNGNGPRCSHIGYCRTINHTHHGGGNHRHLCRPAGSSADKRKRNIVDKLGKTAVFQECPKQYKNEDIGCRNPAPGTENPDRIPGQGFDDAFERECSRAEHTRYISSPDCKIG